MDANEANNLIYLIGGNERVLKAYTKTFLRKLPRGGEKLEGLDLYSEFSKELNIDRQDAKKLYYFISYRGIK